MKKNLLSLSIGVAMGGLMAAGAANAATSVAGSGTYSATAGTMTATDANATLELNPGGIGHIGIIPYYTVNNNNQTVVSITNTDTVNGKAVKVRFRSAANSDDVFDFTLFLSPGDVWAGAINRDSNGYASMATPDNSCTLPATINQDFVNNRLPPNFTDAQKAAWSREGYVEVLTMADIPPVTGTITTPTLYDAIKHNANGVPSCATAPLQALLDGANVNTEAAAAKAGLDTPSTGIYTNSFIVNTADAYMAWATESTAIQAIVAAAATETGAPSNSRPARGRMVLSPQTSVASTGSAMQLTADPLFRTDAVALVNGVLTPVGTASAISALEFDFPDLSTPYVGTAALSNSLPPAQAQRLSASLAVTSIANDYSVKKAYNSKTDFTFAMPTRRYHAAVDYTGGGTAAAPAPRAIYAPAATGARFYTPEVTALGTSGIQAYQLCMTMDANAVSAWDRSERGLAASGGTAVVSPGSPTARPALCGEVSVLTINSVSPNAPEGTGVLSAGVAVKNINAANGSNVFEEGWALVTTKGVTNTQTNQPSGMPILGSSYVGSYGNKIGSSSVNLGWTFRHKTTPATR